MLFVLLPIFPMQRPTSTHRVEGVSAHVHAAGTLLPAQEVMQAEATPCSPLPVDNEFEALLSNAKLSLANMYAEGTKRNHRSNLKQFLLFCVKFGKPVCPTNRDTLMAFARLESATIGYDSIKNIFSSIKFLHKAMSSYSITFSGVANFSA